MCAYVRVYPVLPRVSLSFRVGLRMSHVFACARVGSLFLRVSVCVRVCSHVSTFD